MAKKTNTKKLDEKFNIDASLENTMTKKPNEVIHDIIDDDDGPLPMPTINVPNTPTINKPTILSPLELVNDILSPVEKNQAVLEMRTEAIIDEMVIDMQKMDEDERYIANKIKSLINSVEDQLSSVNYMISSSPEPETLTAAASLINASSGLLKELNKNRIEAKKNIMLIKLEKVKLLKQRELQNSTVNLGKGNTINIQQNNTNTNTMISTSQEDIVRRLIAAEEKKDIK